MSKGKLFKKLVNAPDILVLPGVYDGFSLKITEQAGFKAAAITGAGVSECQFVEAGADIFYADALMTVNGMKTVVENIPAPLCVNMGLGFQTRGTTPLITPKQLQAMGVAMVTFPRLLTTAAVKGMQNCMAAFKIMVGGEEPEAREDLQVSFKEIGELMELPILDNLDEKYAVNAEAAE